MSQALEGIEVREAQEGDVPEICEIFTLVYGSAYPYQGFFDHRQLKRSVWSDDILMLVAQDSASGSILGTASVVFDVGAHSDLLGEFGRLAVHPDARGRRVGSLLMSKRVEFIQNRLHVGLVENRTEHPYSQQISHSHGFAPVGFLPLKHLFSQRESLALFVRHFGNALSLRCNHPRIVPEAYALAHVALEGCGLPTDVVVDDESPAYPQGTGYELEHLTAEGLPALLRIERGRVRNREVFGPMKLHYGFFRIRARRATYLVAHQPGPGTGPVAGAVGYTHDPIEHVLRIFELIVRDEQCVRVLMLRLLELCRERGVAYVEVDVSAYAPRMQRTLLELGFLPVAYVPAMVFHEVERLDVVKMALLLVPAEVGDVYLTPGARVVAELVLRSFARQAVLPQIAAAIDRLDLFAGLGKEQATRLAGACSSRQFAAGELLFSRGGEALHMHLVIQGRVRILSGEPPRVVGTVEEGAAVGEFSLLAGTRHSASAVAEKDTVTAALSREDLAELTRLRPDIGVVLFRNLAIGLGAKLQRLDASLSEP